MTFSGTTVCATLIVMVFLYAIVVRAAEAFERAAKEPFRIAHPDEEEPDEEEPDEAEEDDEPEEEDEAIPFSEQEQESTVWAENNPEVNALWNALAKSILNPEIIEAGYTLGDDAREAVRDAIIEDMKTWDADRETERHD